MHLPTGGMHVPPAQVYRGRVRGSGRAVAVKVQRPGVRESIALDIHILRGLAAIVRRLRRINSDLPVLLDEVSTHLCIANVGMLRPRSASGIPETQAGPVGMHAIL